MKVIFFVLALTSSALAEATYEDYVYEEFAQDPRFEVTQSGDQAVIKVKTKPSKNQEDNEELKKPTTHQGTFSFGYGFGNMVASKKSYANNLPANLPYTAATHHGMYVFDAGVRPPARYLKRLLIGGWAAIQKSYRNHSKDIEREYFPDSQGKSPLNPREFYDRSGQGVLMPHGVFLEVDAIVLKRQALSGGYFFDRGYVSNVRSRTSNDTLESGYQARWRMVFMGDGVNAARTLGIYALGKYSRQGSLTLVGGITFTMGKRARAKEKVEK